MPISERARRLDAALCAIAPSVKVVSRLSWPESAINDFLNSWRRGEPQIPEVRYATRDLPADAQSVLESIRDEADPDDPIEGYLRATAESYALAVELLSQAGRPSFLELSRRLYGDPYDRLPGTYITHFEAAQQLRERQRLGEADHVVALAAELRIAEHQHRHAAAPARSDRLPVGP